MASRHRRADCPIAAETARVIATIERGRDVLRAEADALVARDPDRTRLLRGERTVLGELARRAWTEDVMHRCDDLAERRSLHELRRIATSADAVLAAVAGGVQRRAA